VTTDDPPLQLSGMAGVRLAPTGELMDLLVVPPQYDEGSGPWPEPDWNALLRQTGLDLTALKPTEPRWTPLVGSDTRRAWVARPWPDRPELRVEAAAFHGRPVYMQVLGPWSRPTRMPGAGDQVRGAQRVRLALRTVLPNVLIVVVGATIVALARRNLALGRGDRRGASRIAATVAALSLVSGLFQTHHVADPGGEWRLFLGNVAFGFFWAAYVWLSYVALEPHLRRRWPTLLVGWTRVLSGRISDPLVGRDVLVGAAFGTVVAVVYHLANALPAWVALPGQTPINTERLALAGAGGIIALAANVVAERSSSPS
jgi:hypothetical protein